MRNKLLLILIFSLVLTIINSDFTSSAPVTCEGTVDCSAVSPNPAVGPFALPSCDYGCIYQQSLLIIGNECVVGLSPLTDCASLSEVECNPVPGCTLICVDSDGDGYGNPASSSCINPELDCNDGNGAINPGAIEMCNGVDDNCDGSVDEGDVCGEELIEDGGVCEGFIDCSAVSPNPAVGPFALPSCDYGCTYQPSLLIIGNECVRLLSVIDCDSLSEIECTSAPGCTPECIDVDGDGYGNPTHSDCTNLELDCNDNNVAINPGAIEMCNGVDDNCDGGVDEGDVCEGELLSIEEELLSIGGGATTYVRANGQLVAKQQGDELLFYHNDPFGSPIAITKEDSSIVRLTDYFPFGKETEPLIQERETKIKFQGIEFDKETKLYKGSSYDPEIGRYIATLKSYVPNFFLPQSLNKYVYKLNNPFKDFAGDEIFPDLSFSEAPSALKSKTANLIFHTSYIPIRFTKTSKALLSIIPQPVFTLFDFKIPPTRIEVPSGNTIFWRFTLTEEIGRGVLFSNKDESLVQLKMNNKQHIDAAQTQILKGKFVMIMGTDQVRIWLGGENQIPALPDITMSVKKFHELGGTYLGDGIYKVALGEGVLIDVAFSNPQFGTLVGGQGTQYISVEDSIPP